MAAKAFINSKQFNIFLHLNASDINLLKFGSYIIQYAYVLHSYIKW